MSRNSGVLRGVILAAFISMIAFVGGLAGPASAADPPLPAPISNDLCGSSKDQVYLADDADPTSEVSWKDAAGTYYAPGQWNSTKGASNLTLTVDIWGGNGLTTYTYPAMSFGVESDSACTPALDTVNVTDMVCTGNGGTLATFTYVNTPDNGWPQTFVTLVAYRADNKQTASFNITNEGVAVPDGASASVRGGNAMEIRTETDFLLLPGTYAMKVQTTETGQRKLPNTFFVPACPPYKVPKGDPSGQGGSTTDGAGQGKPKGVLKQVSPSKVKVKAVNKGVARKTAFKVLIDPKKGKTYTKSFKVASGKKKVRTYQAAPRTRFILKARVNGSLRTLAVLSMK